jgi:hypothetical protein
MWAVSLLAFLWLALFVSPVMVLTIELLFNLFFSFATSLGKLKTGTANRWETTSSKPPVCTNHYDEPIRNTEQQVDHIYYTLFCRCSPAMATRAIMRSQNHFSEPNQHRLNYLHPILLCRITYQALLGMLLARSKVTVKIFKKKGSNFTSFLEKKLCQEVLWGLQPRVENLEYTVSLE